MSAAERRTRRLEAYRRKHPPKAKVDKPPKPPKAPRAVKTKAITKKKETVAKAPKLEWWERGQRADDPKAMENIASARRIKSMGLSAK